MQSPGTKKPTRKSNPWRAASRHASPQAGNPSMWPAAHGPTSARHGPHNCGISCNPHTVFHADQAIPAVFLAVYACSCMQGQAQSTRSSQAGLDILDWFMASFSRFGYFTCSECGECNSEAFWSSFLVLNMVWTP